MKVLICEDELIVAEYIKETCIEQNLEVIGVAKNRENAILLIANEKPDIVLLDINMEERFSGIRIAQHIRKISYDVCIIFISAFSDSETLEAAFKTNPDGYLVKPLDKSTLIANLLLASFKVNWRKEKKEKKIIQLKTDAGELSVDITNVLYVESEGNYCDFIFENGIRITERISLSNVSESCVKELIRTHKSFCINPTFASRFTSVKIYLLNGTHIPIGRKYKENITEFLKANNTEN
ncbi:MAG: response regulator transcription factor [Crocinitomicaceae bacterium]|nr:response regulator transcription factor [Crocinitomicaceae bacterium]